MTMRIAMLLTVAVALLAGCKEDRSRQVVVYMYSEYIDDATIQQFEEKTGLKLKVDVYESSEEMINKLQYAGGAGQYDVVVVSDAHVPALVKLGLVQPLDPAQVPNRTNVDKKFTSAPFDPEGKYSLPYLWGTVGMMYDGTRVSGDDLSWSLLFDEARQPGRFVLMDSMRDMLGIALAYRGHSMNSRKPEEVRAAGELLQKAKRSPKAIGFEGGAPAKNRVVAGDAVLAVAYNGDAVRGIAENPKAKYAIPREGGIIWVDVMVLPAKAPNQAGGLAFMNHILDARVGAQLANFMRYPTPNAAAMPLIKPEDLVNEAIYPKPQTAERLQWLEDLGEDAKLYDEVWTAAKSQ